MTNLTISIDENIVRHARVRAIQEGTSVSAKVREFLAHYSQAPVMPTDANAPAALHLPVLEGQGGLQPDIDPTSNQSLLQAADDAA